ncbi:cysteine hydrolase [Candidatus Micrarchaeota archaeon]|nr:cysteine hydrolase [Candidatus Micrarchaeota archaeon]
MKSALMVIDMQHGTYDAVNAATQRRVLRNVKLLESAARKAGSPVVWATYVYNPRNSPRVEWGRYLLPDRQGTKLVGGLKPIKGDLKVERSAYDCFQKSNLQAKLAKSGVKRLIICGLNTEQCVLTTAQHAYDACYDVNVVRDAVGTCAPELHGPALKMIGEYFGKVVSMSQARGLMG